MSKTLKILSRPQGNVTAREFLHQWPHSVDKDWNMFKKED